jgi:hypothetical protein
MEARVTAPARGFNARREAGMPSLTKGDSFGQVSQMGHLPA